MTINLFYDSGHSCGFPVDLYFNEEIPAEIIVGGWLFFRAKVEYTV